MNLILNILWFVLGGFIAGTLWMVAGVLLMITVIGAPWAFAAFRIGRFSYAPFGRQAVPRPVAPEAGHHLPGSRRYGDRPDLRRQSRPTSDRSASFISGCPPR